jgi:hypothetical protein
MIVDFLIEISPLLTTDSTIFASSDFATVSNVNSVGTIYALEQMKINYSIIQSSTPGVILLSTNLPINTENKIQTGQILTISKILDFEDQGIIFVGFVKRVVYNTSINGNYVTLLVDSLLSQLTQLPMVTNNIETRQYDSSLISLFTNQITQENLWTNIIKNSLIQLASTKYIDYSELKYPPFAILDGKTILPNKLWANVQINQSRDSVLREILAAYSRIMYQDENGTIFVQPLFTNDTASEWNITYGQNDDPEIEAIYESIQISDNAASMINSFTQNNLGGFPGYFNTSNEPQIQATAFANKTTFPRVNALNTSNYFNTGVIQYSSINQGMLKDTTYTNAWAAQSANSGFTKGLGDQFKLPQIYAQNSLAQELMEAYNIDVSYVYQSVAAFDLPLGQIVAFNVVDDQDLLQYNNMVCYGAQLHYKGYGDGVSMHVSFAPINSITGIWDVI